MSRAYAAMSVYVPAALHVQRRAKIDRHTGDAPRAQTEYLTKRRLPTQTPAISTMRSRTTAVPS